MWDMLPIRVSLLLWAQWMYLELDLRPALVPLPVFPNRRQLGWKIRDRRRLVRARRPNGQEGTATPTCQSRLFTWISLTSLIMLTIITVTRITSGEFEPAITYSAGLIRTGKFSTPF